MWEVKPIMQGLLAGAIMSTQKSRLLSVTMKMDLLHSKQWMDDIAEKHEMEKVIPGMEPTGHYWLNLGAYLQGQGMRPVHVNPHHVKKSKELDDNNPNKNDRKDPRTIAGLVK